MTQSIVAPLNLVKDSHALLTKMSICKDSEERECTGLKKNGAIQYQVSAFLWIKSPTLWKVAFSLIYFCAEGGFNIKIQNKSCINDNKNIIFNCLKNTRVVRQYVSLSSWISESRAWRGKALHFKHVRP